MNRKAILKHIENNLQSNIAELTQALSGYEAASNLDEGDTMDPDDYSKQAEYKEMQMRMQIQLDQAHAQLDKLQELTSKSVHTVESGAIVETDKNIIFIGISFPVLHVDHKELIGITTESPAYAGMKGKQKGDTIKLGSKEYPIENIY